MKNSLDLIDEEKVDVFGKFQIKAVGAFERDNLCAMRVYAYAHATISGKYKEKIKGFGKTFFESVFAKHVHCPLEMLKKDTV